MHDYLIKIPEYDEIPANNSGTLDKPLKELMKKSQENS